MFSCLFMFILPEMPFPCLVVYVNPTLPSRSGSHFKYLLRKLCLTFVAAGRKDILGDGLMLCNVLALFLFFFLLNSLLSCYAYFQCCLYRSIIHHPKSLSFSEFRSFQVLEMCDDAGCETAHSYPSGHFCCKTYEYLFVSGWGRSDFTINELRKCFDFQICLTFGSVDIRL